MKLLIKSAVTFCSLAFAYSFAVAEEKPAAPAAPAPATEAVTLEGNITCAKCALKEAGVTACTDVLKVGTGDSQVKYYLTEGGKVKTSVHQCRGEAAVKATGTVTERDGKKHMVVTAIEKK